MSKTIIGPLLGFIFVTINMFFHIDLSEDLKQQLTQWITDGVALSLIVYGIFKNHKKPKK